MAASLSNCLRCLSWISNYCSWCGEFHPCFSSFTFSVQVSPIQSSFSFFLHPIEYCMGLYVLSGGQGLLPALGWCSVRSSASEDVFLVHPRRKKYSTSTYTSAILSPSAIFVLYVLSSSLMFWDSIIISLSDSSMSFNDIFRSESPVNISLPVAIWDFSWFSYIIKG